MVCEILNDEIEKQDSAVCEILTDELQSPGLAVCQILNELRELSLAVCKVRRFVRR